MRHRPHHRRRDRHPAATTRRCCRVLVRRARSRSDADGDDEVAAVDGGFLSVANNRVSILAEHAQLANEIDLEGARRDLEEARSSAESPMDPDLLHAEARVFVGEKNR